MADDLIDGGTVLATYRGFALLRDHSIAGYRIYDTGRSVTVATMACSPYELATWHAHISRLPEDRP